MSRNINIAPPTSSFIALVGFMLRAGRLRGLGKSLLAWELLNISKRQDDKLSSSSWNTPLNLKPEYNPFITLAIDIDVFS